MGDRLDRRRHPIRDDLAAAYLSGRTDVPRFAEPRRGVVVRETTSIHARADAQSMQTSELLFGEPVDIYESKDGWAWCQGVLDGYVGYVDLAALGDAKDTATHMVSARLSHLFPTSSIKEPPLARVTLGARLTIAAVSGKFARLTDGRFIIASHIRPLGAVEAAPLDVALRSLGAPYLWGGRSSLGLDCSGLLQVAHQACGHLPPRDSDMLSQELGEARAVPPGPEGLQRNDCVFFPGHCMIADGAGGLVHANATHMMVTHEPATAVFARTRGGWGAVTDIRNIQIG